MTNREEYVIYNGENYGAWRFATMNHLKSKKIWRTIRDPVNPHIKENKEGEETIGDPAANEAWLEIDEQAMGAIGKFIDPKFESELSKFTTASELWNGVENLHKAQTAESTGMYRDAFSRTNLAEGGDINGYFNRLAHLQTLLASSNAPITDGELIFHILKTFPPSFIIFIQALRAQKGYLNDLTSLKTCLKEEWQRREISGEMRHKNESFGLTTIVKCKTCGKNHDTSKCWANGGADAANRPSWYKPHKVKANTVSKKRQQQQVSVPIKDKTFTFMASKTETFNDVWLLDSGATEHIINDISVFTEILKNETQITGFNNTQSSAEGIGQITLKTKTGNVINLNDCLYVPTATVNLISMSKLIDKGAVIKADSNSMTVKVNGKNAMSAQLKDGLFHLNLNTATDYSTSLQVTAKPCKTY